ncbi:MAG: 2Fe-2S iron-sulfur cluster-binding protein [Chloroflexi bacterium]|nr:2Fe-2S iron-sulfur cluster-binding protein [Chloroflexota bacterium]
MTRERLPHPAGSRIDRTRPVTFEFEGRDYTGYAGDTIASALAASGVWCLSRSFKLHRPRGSFGFAGDEAGSLVQLATEPNVHADTRRIEPGMRVQAQNTVGGLERDWAALLGHFERFLPVGFYYKAFYKPRGVWNWWEKIIRRTAGLGRVDRGWEPEYFDKAYAYCDVAVIGGGAAGLAAATACGAQRLDVLLVEREPELGGWLTYGRQGPGDSTLDDLRGRVQALPSVRVMTSAICTGWYGDNWLAVAQGNRLHKVRAKSVIACTGGTSQPAVFRNNDLPGIVSATAAQRLIRHHGVRPGRRAVVLAAGDEGYAAALDLAENGTDVAAVVDCRPDPPAGPMASEAEARGHRILSGHTVREAGRDPQRLQVGGALVTRVTGPGSCAADGERIDCDLLVVAVGVAPAGGLLAQAGAKFRPSAAEAVPRLASLPDHAFAAGVVAGAATVDEALAQGEQAAQAAATEIADPSPATHAIPEVRDSNESAPFWPVFPHPEGHEFVDLDEDVTVREIEDALAEGYEDIELLKRYSTVGMGPSQGRLSAIATAAVTAAARDTTSAEVGATTRRPPAAPTRFGLFAGRGFQPVRHTPMHRWHVGAGAQMMTAGLWMRPAFYGRPDDRADAIADEVLAVRRAVGLIDVSTLGGFDIRGPDALEFLERAYTPSFRRLRVGRARYALLTDEQGVVVDDGVAARLRPDHFYVTASTSGAEQLYPLLLWYQAQWQLDVDIADVTPAYGAINIAGPKARRVLEKLGTDIDCSPEACPYLAARTGTLAGVDVRLLRIGFVGELGYEIHPPASQSLGLWEALIDAGREYGIRPFGVEAQRVLRLEKGHVIVTQDTDGLTHPHEVDLGWALGRRKPFFVGKRSIEILRDKGLARRLVGYAVPDRNAPVPEEGHLVVRGGEITGRVTSSAWSPVLDQAIGLAYVAPEQAEVGSIIAIKAAGGRLIEAEVARLPFYDPDNTRQAM